MQSVRFFQLTRDILLEYRYNALEIQTEGDVSIGFKYPDFTGYIYDISQDQTNLLGKTTLPNGNTFFYSIPTEDVTWRDNAIITNNFKAKTVVPFDKSESTYVSLSQIGTSFPDIVSEEIPSTTWDSSDESYSDITYDTIILHFTGRNIYGEYQNLIFDTYVYAKDNSKIRLASTIFNKTDDIILESTPLIIGEKRYVSKVGFRIPSIKWINDNSKDRSSKILEAIAPKGLQKNTPICFNLIGCKNSYQEATITYYKTESFNSVNIPQSDIYNEIVVSIIDGKYITPEDKKLSPDLVDGDLFNILTTTRNGESLADYLELLTGNAKNSYSLLHELQITERYGVGENEVIKTLGKEYRAVGLEFVSSMDEVDFNDPIIYRPVVGLDKSQEERGLSLTSFTITDTLKIYNNSDNTTIVKTATYDVTGDDVSRFKKLTRTINNSQQIYNINLYNKRSDREVDSINFYPTGGVTLDPAINKETGNNKTINVTSFIETNNIAISTQQVTLSDE